MPKNLSTREKVFEVADAMLEQGARPTQQSVRERIGSGSLTTINKALNEWWQQLGERITRHNQHPELPEPVLIAANQMWDRALAYAEERFVEQREKILADQRAMREQHSRADESDQQALRTIQVQNARLLEQCEELARAKRELEQNLLRAEEEIYQLNRKLENSQRELKEQLLLADSSGSANGEALIEARVRLKIQQEETERLKALNAELNRENALLKQQR